MQPDELIAVEVFCLRHEIEPSFITDLHNMGLIQITPVEEKLFIPAIELGKVEKFMRMHYDLEINLEGIEAISNLLEQLNDLHQEITILRNRLRIYEE